MGSTPISGSRIAPLVEAKIAEYNADMSQFVKIVVYVPETHADMVRKILGENGCGHIGNYDFCSFSVKGIGRFRPKSGAKPFIGKEDILEEVVEERIETICPAQNTDDVLAALKKIHPYEEPAIDIYPLGNL